MNMEPTDLATKADGSLSVLHWPASQSRFWTQSVVAMIVLNVLLSLLNIAVGVPRPNAYDPAGYMAWEQAVLAGEGFDPTHRLQGNTFFPVAHINGRDRVIDKFPIGWSLAVFPFAVTGQAFSWTMNHLLHRRYPLDGTAAPVVRMAWVGVCFWCTIGLWTAFSVTRRLLDPASAAVGVGLAWLGTAAIVYTWKSPGWSHPLSFTFITLCYQFGLSAAATGESRKSRTLNGVLWGVAAGMVFCLRHLNVVLVLPSAVLLLYRGVPRMLREAKTTAAAIPRVSPSVPDWSLLPRILPATIIGAIPFIFLQSLVWRVDYGKWYFNGYALLGEYFTHSLTNLFRFLTSSLHGLFFWHLLTAAAIVGVIRLARLSLFGLSTLLSVLGMILLYGFWWDWDLGPCFGARWTTDLLLIWAVGIAVMTRDQNGLFQPRRAIVLALLAIPNVLLVGGQLIGKVPQYGRLHLYIPGMGWHELP